MGLASQASREVGGVVGGEGLGVFGPEFLDSELGCGSGLG